MFYIDNDTQLTLSDIKAYIDAFKINELPRLKRLDNYYFNKNEKITTRKMNDSQAPNNKVSHSFAHYITNINVAMLVGNKICYKSDQDITVYQDILDKANEESINNKLAKDASKFAYGIQFVYLDKDLNISLATLNPLQTAFILSNDIKPELLYAINFWSVKDIITKKDIDYIRVYSKEAIITYKEDVLIEDIPNQWSDIQVVIYENNDDLTGDYELVTPLIDAYDFLESDSANQSDYFNNCYVVLKVDSIPTDSKELEALLSGVENMKDKHVILVTPEGDFRFVDRPIIENEVEKVRLVQDIHKLSFTPDLNDQNFANNVSGVAMKYKLLGMLNNIKNKRAKFTEAINKRNKLIFDMMRYRMLDTPEYVQVIFTDSLPANDLETAQMINQLSGKLSNETLVSKLSFVDDAAYEMELLEKENSIDSYAINLNKEDDTDEE